jgi:hypothetical protein
MAKIELHDMEPEFKVERRTDGDVVFTVNADGVEVDIHIGKSLDSAQGAYDKLRELADTGLEAGILDGWEDTPGVFDGYVVEDNGKYYVRLSGHEITSPWQHGNGENFFPSREIAIYALAEAAAKTGEECNMWRQYEAYTVDIGEAVYAYQENNDEGSLRVKPLDGVVFAEDDEVLLADDDEGWLFVVDRDFGKLGVLLHISGDPTIERFVEDRSLLKRAPDEDETEHLG